MATALTHVRPSLLESHLPFNVLVIRALETFFPAAGDIGLRVSTVDHQQEFIGHFLLNLDGLIVAQDVECGCLSRPGGDQ